MSSIYQLKPKFQGLLRPLVQKLASWHITANQVTIIACALSVILGIYLMLIRISPSVLLVVPIFLFVRMALNAIDGILAREHQMQSKLGAILNELSDVIADCFLYYPLGLLFHVGTTLIAFFLFLSVLSEMVGVVAVQIGSSRRYDGPLGKSDRAFIFGLLSLLYAFQISFEAYVTYGFLFLCFLEALTIWNRSRMALKDIA